MNSHIQIPKLILKNFADHNHRLHYYDFEKGVYGRSSPKSFYTEENYYSEEVEKYWDVEIESKLGVLAKLLKELTFEGKFSLPANYENTAIDYFFTCT